MNFKCIIIILLSTSFLNSCSEKLIDSENNYIVSSKSISNILDNEDIYWIIDKDSIPLNVNFNEDYYDFKCKNGKRVLRKKKFKLFPLTTKYDHKKAKEIISYNEELKKNNLLGVFSKLITLSDNKYLFQEEIGKRFIESNSKREGIIIKTTNTDSLKIEGTKGEIIFTVYKKSIANYINDNLIDSKYIDMDIINRHNEISKKFNINFYPNYFYLNPITSKLEAIFLNKGYFKEKISTKTEIVKFKPSLNYLNHFNIIDSNLLTLKKDKTIISEKLIIPKNFSVKINAAQSIDFVESGSILSYSTFNINGTKENPVKIYSSDSSGQGLHIIHGNSTSKVNYLEFIDQTAFLDSTKNNNWSLPSAFTVYGGEISINHSIFKNLSSEDAVNLFRCKYTFTDSKIENTFSDALDADFSSGKIINSYFINCGNDGVDISGGILSLSNSYFNNILDKAISAGEQSVLNVSNCKIENSDMGLISKDLSIAESENNEFSNCEIAYCAFQKKGEFGSGNIQTYNDTLINCSLAHLIETNSKLVINNKEIHIFQNNVIDYLYGKKYGKATVK